LRGHAREEDRGQRTAPATRGEQRCGGEKGRRARREEERDRSRLGRRDGDAGARRRRAAGDGEHGGGAAVHFETRRREGADHGRGKRQDLKEAEETDRQEAGCRLKSGTREAVVVSRPRDGEHGGQEGHRLYSEGAFRLYAAEGERSGRGEREEEADSSRLSRLAAQGLGSFAKPLKNAHWIALALLALALSLQAASPTDDFYLARLAAGRAEAAAGRHLEATDELRIAVFGFLDQPALLLEGLGRLALSQVAAGRSEAADETLRRLVEVASRFDAWEATELELASRSEVAALVARRLGPEAVRILAAPTPTPTPTPTSTPTSKSTPTPVPTVIAESGRPASTLAVTPSPTVGPTAPPGPLPTVTPTPAPTRVAALPPTPAPRRAAEKAPPRETPSPAAVLAESRKLVERGRYVENLRRLVAAVAVDPANRELRKALLEGAVLTKDWGAAVAQLAVIRPFQPGEEPSMFYAAVALEETGAGSEARALIEAALPALKRTPFIDFYAKKILGAVPRR
jgi:hypothetical protein